MKLSTLALAPIAAALFTFNVNAKGHDHDNQHAIFFPGETV
nr:MBL fold metallo-hydrolase [Vibrio anguillarum]